MTTSQTPANSPEPVAARLPEVSAQLQHDAKSPYALNWVDNLMSYSTGHLTNDLFSRMGVVLQVVSVNTARCVLVVDEDDALETLKTLTISFEAAGKTLEIDPFTVLMEYYQRTEPVASSIPDAGAVTINTTNVTSSDDYNFGMEVA